MSSQHPYGSVPFWDFIQFLEPDRARGRGGDHHGGFPFAQFGGFPFGGQGHHPGAGGPWGDEYAWGDPWGHGRGGRWARHARRQRDGMNTEDSNDQGATSATDNEHDANNEKSDSPDTMRVDAPDPAEVAPEESDSPPAGRGRGHCGRGRRGGPGGCRRGPPHGHHHGHGPRQHHGPHGPRGPHHGPPPAYSNGFDFGSIMRGLSNHPFFANLREQAETYRSNADSNTHHNDNNDDVFAPAVDIFNTETAYVLHVALPGAKKEDIGVNWDQDRSNLNIAGVIHRPGDEEFLQTLVSGERKKIGMFERNVTLPPAGASDKDEIDHAAISARMEDGILIVTVPKLEKEWTEILKVDIE